MAALVPGSPAHATASADVVPISIGGAAGIAECSAVGAVTNTSTMTLAVRGTANLVGATQVSLVCHVWQDQTSTTSARHGHATGTGVAGTAVAAGVAQNFHLANYSICAEVFIVTLSGGYHIDCPDHP
jgi:hypothetical protein